MKNVQNLIIPVIIFAKASPIDIGKQGNMRLLLPPNEISDFLRIVITLSMLNSAQIFGAEFVKCVLLHGALCTMH